MKKHKRRILWLTGVAAGLFGPVLVLLLFLPVLVNLELVKQTAFGDLSRAIGGVIESRSIDVSLFPRPSITLRGGRVSLPEKFSGTFSSLSVYPEITSLLRGRIRISAITLQAPGVQARLPADLEKLGGEKISLQVVKEAMAFVTSKVAPLAPGLVVSVEKGSLTLIRQKRPTFWLTEIRGRVGLSGDRLDVQIDCDSNVWKHASLSGWLRPGKFQSEGRLQLAQLRPDLILRNLLPSMEPRVEDSQADVDLSFGNEGAASTHAEVRLDVPKATLRRRQEAITLKKVSLKGSFRQSSGTTSISVTELTSAYPHLTMTGNLTVEPVSPRAGVTLRASAVDVESVRKASLFLAGRLSFVRSIFQILKKGNVPEMSLSSQGRTIDDLATKERIVIRGSIIGGNIFIDKPRLDIEDVTGNALIERGVIEGRNLQGRLGTAKGTKGLFRIDLKRDPEPFHLDVSVDADGADLPAHLRDLVRDETFQRELDLIEEVRGKASGRLVVDRGARGTEVAVEVKAFTLHALYQRFPHPLELSGKFRYDQSTATIAVGDLSAKSGTSFTTQLSGKLNLQKEPHLQIASGPSAITLDEVYPWLSSLAPLRDVFKNVDSAKGVVRLDDMHLEGPLSEPGRWQFQARGSVENLAVAAERLPAPVRVSSGSFKIGPEQLSLSHIKIKSLDSSLTVTGVLNNYLEGLDSADLSLEGEIGAKSALRISDVLKPPKQLRTRSPFSLSQTRLRWKKNGQTSLSGNLEIENRLELSLDVSSEPNDLVIRRLLIRDAQSDASLSLHMKRGELDLAFKGALAGSTLDRLLDNNEFLTGAVRGDLSAHVVLDRPLESVARGTLEGTGLKYPLSDLGPIQVAAFALGAKGNQITLESTVLVLGHQFKATGKASSLADGLVLDGDLSTNGFGLEEVFAAVRDRKGRESLPRLPLRGALRLRSDYVKYGRFTWRPVRATIGFGGETTIIDVTEANLCGIATPVHLEVSPMGLELRAKASVKDQDLRGTLTCLSDYRVADGRFSFDADLSGKGDSEGLASSLTGPLTFEARKGRIYRYGFLGKVFEILSPTGILKIPDLDKEGFSYNSIKAKGDLKEGKITVKEAYMNASAANIAFNGEIDLFGRRIDGVVLVIPFRTIDRIISAIPVVGYLMAERLVALPVAVNGDLTDPKTTPLSPSAVGASLLDTVKRIFRLPLHLIQPLLPSEKKK
jgi:hypothetical protein